jgi:hypothetical protein
LGLDFKLSVRGLSPATKKKGKHTVLALQVKSNLFDCEITDRFDRHHFW